MIKIEEARKILGHTYKAEFAGIEFYYRPLNLVLDVSSADNQHYEFFAQLTRTTKDGKVLSTDTTLYHAESFIQNIKEGTLKQL